MGALARNEFKVTFGIMVMVNHFLNPITTSVPHHIETSQLICNANRLTGFFMMGNIGR